MKIIDRYLVREIFPPFFVGIIVFTLVLLMSQFLRLVEMIVNKGVGMDSALRLIAYLLPSILVMTIPMAVLLGTLVAFGRMSADNEITALKSGRLSISRLSLPVVIFSLAACLLTFYLIAISLPRSNQSFRNLMFEIVRGKASLGLKERVFNDDFDGLTIYINEIPVSSDPVMRGIIIHDSRGEMENPKRDAVTIFASEGRLLSDSRSQDVVFRLKDGSIHSLGKDKLKYEQINFSLHDLRLTMIRDIPGAADLPKGLREMTIGELLERIENFERQGLPVAPPKVELHKKFAIPFACLIFGFLGISLGLIFRKGEKMVAFAVCIGVVIIYYIFLVAGEPMGKQGLLPPWLSMWGANIFFSFLTLVLYLTVVYERVPATGLINQVLIRFRYGRRKQG